MRSKLSRLLGHSVFAIFLLLEVAGTAHAQSVGRLLFVNVDSAAGANIIGGIDEQGHYHVLASGGADRTIA